MNGINRIKNSLRRTLAYASSLGLTKHFLDTKLPEVAYYCALREAYPKKQTCSFMSGRLRFVFAGLKCAPHDRFLDKLGQSGTIGHSRLFGSCPNQA